MSDLVLVAIALLAFVVVWELADRWRRHAEAEADELAAAVDEAVREAVALVRAGKVPPAAPAPRPATIAPSPLPPPPAERPAPAQAFPTVLFQRRDASVYEQQLAAADWALGFMCGHSWPGGLRCDDRVKH